MFLLGGGGPFFCSCHMVTATAQRDAPVPGSPPIDPGLRDLPQANVRRADQAFPDGEFVTLENVPVFAEHETTTKDGRKIRFTHRELQLVAERCNRRIRDTGDYAAITLGHTPDPDDPNGQQPDIAGFAGPFRLGTMGQPGGRQRYAILADFHVFKHELPRVRRNPRRSPELWLEDKFEEMFLDPIALLGAQPPRLDMGLLYSATRHGRVCEKYTAVAPAAGNVAVRSDDFIDQTKHRGYSADSPSPTGGQTMISPDDIRQIVDALEQLDWVQAVKQLIQQQQGPNTSLPPTEEFPPADGMPAEPPLGQPPAADPLAGPPPPAPEAAAPDLSPASQGPGEASPPPPPAPAADEEPEKLGQKRYEANATGEYQTADQKEDMGGSKIEHDPIGSPRKYAADDMDDDEFEEYAKQRRSRRANKKKHYESGSADADGSDKPTEATVEPDDPGPKGNGTVSDEPDEAAGSYQKATPPAKFSRDQAEEQREVVKLRDDVGELRKQLDTERGARVDAERYSALSERRPYYALDLKAEVERCRYSKMTADQFDEHLESIEDNYRKIPFGHGLPTHTHGSDAAAAGASDRPGSSFARTKYSKEHSEQARKICEAKAASGEIVDYETVLESLQRGEQVPA